MKSRKKCTKKNKRTRKKLGGMDDQKRDKLKTAANKFKNLSNNLTEASSKSTSPAGWPRLSPLTLGDPHAGLISPITIDETLAHLVENLDIKKGGRKKRGGGHYYYCPTTEQSTWNDDGTIRCDVDLQKVDYKGQLEGELHGGRKKNKRTRKKRGAGGCCSCLNKKKKKSAKYEVATPAERNPLLPNVLLRPVSTLSLIHI